MATFDIDPQPIPEYDYEHMSDFFKNHPLDPIVEKAAEAAFKEWIALQEFIAGDEWPDST